MTIGESIRTFRESKGLSQAQFARQVGVVQTQISQIENGASRPSLGLLERIAAAMGTTPGALIDGTEPVVAK